MAKILKYSFCAYYCVTGVSNGAVGDEFIEQAKCIMSRDIFNLKNWENNVQSQNLSKSSGVIKLLEILWYCGWDMLKCNLTSDKLNKNLNFTKTLILSSMQKYFDPTGL